MKVLDQNMDKSRQDPLKCSLYPIHLTQLVKKYQYMNYSWKTSIVKLSPRIPTKKGQTVQVSQYQNFQLSLELPLSNQKIIT